MGDQDHKKSAESETGPAKCAVLTISDTRTPESDTSGKLAFEILTKFAHTVIESGIVKNERKAIVAAIEHALKSGADFVVTIGGTGMSKKDVSVEAVRDLIEKELPGFGEMFRTMSVREIGTAAIMTRSLLGVTGDGALILALPGSRAAVHLALEGIVVNELKHLLWEARRYQ